MKLHVLFRWGLFRREMKRLSLQGPVRNCHLGAGTQVLPLTPTEGENTPPTTADFQLLKEFFSSTVSTVCCNGTAPILLPFLEDQMSPPPTLQVMSEIQEGFFLLLKREFSVVLPDYICTFNLYFELLPNPS